MEYNSSDTNFFIEMRDDLEREIITLTNIISKKVTIGVKKPIVNIIIKKTVIMHIDE